MASGNQTNNSLPIPLAGKSPRAWIVFFLIVAAGLLADLLSKWAVFRWLATEQRRNIIPGLLDFSLSVNEGIVFGLPMPQVVVVVATLLAITAVVYIFATSPLRARWTHAALAMILAGAMGNLYDRLFSEVQLPGRPLAVRQVRDFIDVGRMYYPWVFNVADVLLVIGVGILMIAWFAQARAEQKAKTSGKA